MEGRLTNGISARLNPVLQALGNRADSPDSAGHGGLTLDQLRHKFGVPDEINDAALGDLRQAAIGIRTAKTMEAMNQASETLAKALTTIGLDKISPAISQAREGVRQVNVDQLAQLLQIEAGSPLERSSMDPIGHTVLNRLRRNKTALVSDIAGQYGHPLHPPTPDPNTIALAKALLSDTPPPDPTGGATHFYSPRYQPKEGQSTAGYDVGGGLEMVDGVTDRNQKPIQNYRPGYTQIFNEVIVPQVPHWVAKFYRQPGDGPVR
jgi:hypothetical protein